jgi:putative polyketide hydroxylase
MTPRGATGLNTALLSGHDLGWKLAWVHRGWAGEELLDTYEAERRPVAEHNVARSVDPNGSLRPAGEGLHVDLGGRIPHLWLADGRSTLDLLGPGLTRFFGPGVEVSGNGARPPVTLRSLDVISARALGIRPGRALVVRPDAVAM